MTDSPHGPERGDFGPLLTWLLSRTGEAIRHPRQPINADRSRLPRRRPLRENRTTFVDSLISWNDLDHARRVFEPLGHTVDPIRGIFYE